MIAPLILALALDAADQERLDDLRRRYFPPERNQLAAHVTMFHQLPGEELRTVLEQVREACRRPPPAVRVAGVRSLGRGAALVLEGPELLELRAGLAAAFAPWLTRQDAQRWNPHVTVQNFVDPAVARALVADLTAGFEPWTLSATGVAVHRYLGGPWEEVGVEPFDG